MGVDVAHLQAEALRLAAAANARGQGEGQRATPYFFFSLSKKYDVISQKQRDFQGIRNRG